MVVAPCGLAEEAGQARSIPRRLDQQRARFIADQTRKRALYGHAYPIDEDFLAALEHDLPPCAGIALGLTAW
jgi:elongation factor P--beta-lysine ligase